MVHADDKFKLVSSTGNSEALKVDASVSYFVEYKSIELVTTRYALHNDLVLDYEKRLASNEPMRLDFTRMSISGQQIGIHTLNLLHTHAHMFQVPLNWAKTRLKCVSC